VTRPDPPPPDRDRPDQDPRGWLERRRDKIAEEIARNRRGEYQVPTWVLTLVLVAFLATWLGLVIFA
jgi:hypothetical protein